MTTTSYIHKGINNIVTDDNLQRYQHVVFHLLSLTTARAFSFQSSTLDSDILKQVISASNSIEEDDEVDI